MIAGSFWQKNGMAEKCYLAERISIASLSFICDTEFQLRILSEIRDAELFSRKFGKSWLLPKSRHEDRERLGPGTAELD